MSDATERKYVWVLQCPCGTPLRGSSEDEIVAQSLAHLAEKHPHMSHYEREDILFMAIKYPDA